MKIIFIGLLNLMILISIQAQTIKSLSVAVLTENYAFPFTRILPIHPGMEIGCTLIDLPQGNFIHNVNAQAGFYHHKKMENGFYLKGEYVFRYTIKEAISIDLPLGAGYQHSFNNSSTYTQNPTSGEWESTTHWGKPHALIDLGLGLTYMKNLQFHPFLRYEAVADFPFYNGFTVIRTFLKLGVSYKIN